MGSSVCLDLTILLEKGFYSITDSFRLARPSPTPGFQQFFPLLENGAKIPRRCLAGKLRGQVQLFNMGEVLEEPQDPRTPGWFRLERTLKPI